MANNPLFNSKVGPNAVTNSENGLNDASKRYTRGRNTFNYSRPHYTSARYADITPFEAINCVEGDIIELGSQHRIFTHTLSSRLMSDVIMKRSYAYVDMLAILPNNWHKIYQLPNFGDDIDASKANTYVPDFFFKFQQMRDNIVGAEFLDGMSKEEINVYLDNLIHYLIMFEHVFSNGSLLAQMGYHASPLVWFGSDDLIGKDYFAGKTFDKAYESLIAKFIGLEQINFDLRYDNGSDVITLHDISIREVLNIIRYNHIYRVSFASSFFPDDEDYEIPLTALGVLKSFWYNMHFSAVDELQTPLNYERLCAYQIACCNFFTRDSVDDIITAKLYRESMQALLYRFEELSPSASTYYRSFLYNGNYYEYDALSGNSLSYALNGFVDLDSMDFLWDDSNEGPLDIYLYFMNIFGFQRSLRYGDYFTGAKSQPLAVGDVTADVTSDGVNAIDMTVALLRARFGNAVNRAGRRPEDYIEEVMDGVAPPEADEPRLLASISSRVSGFEVENTAENQGDIVTILQSSDSNNVYQFAVGTPSIVIGLLTFDVQRVYSRTGERFFYNEDRYDMFNKFMQYTGDQKILASERDTAADSGLDGVAFGYALHDMHYKQRYPIATGAFVDFLPSYLFVTDNDETGHPDEDPILTISPDYVRAKNGEFDRFYKSLTNYSLAGYYHFFIKFDNICIAHRKMDYKPSIL